MHVDQCLRHIAKNIYNVMQVK